MGNTIDFICLRISVYAQLYQILLAFIPECAWVTPLTLFVSVFQCTPAVSVAGIYHGVRMGKPLTVFVFVFQCTPAVSVPGIYHGVRMDNTIDFICIRISVYASCISCWYLSRSAHG